MDVPMAMLFARDYVSGSGVVLVMLVMMFMAVFVVLTGMTVAVITVREPFPSMHPPPPLGDRIPRRDLPVNSR